MEALKTRPGSNVVHSALEEIAALIAERLSTSADVREQHGQDLTWNKGAAPDAVAFAESSEEVAAIVSICARHGVPVIPFGAGTSLESHISAPYGGISIDTSSMNQIVAVNAEDMDCTVQAGVKRIQLNEYLRDTGLFFPIDPGADATLGGMASTRASGTNAVRYGTMRENVLNVTAVLPDGEIVRTARRARKSSAGYDLTRLLVGSEGTLGVITEVTLRLHGIPEAISAGVCGFPDVRAACDAAIMTIQSGVPIARVELVDEVQIRASNAYSVEFHGSEGSVKEQSETFGAIASDFGGGTFEWATQTEDRERLWRARHNAFHAANAANPGERALVTDVCVPISRLADCVEETRADLDRIDQFAAIVGHVGDGNFHVQLFADPENDAELSKCHEFLDRLVMRALAMDGTCTGEHGVGMGKRQFLEAEHGTGVRVMRAIKTAIDPQNIMNPGKIIAV